MKHLYVLFALLGFTSYSFSQNDGQSLKGNIVDKQSQNPLMGVAVFVQLNDTTLRTKSDSLGNYRFEHLKPGRYELVAKYTNYRMATIPNIIITAGKEVVVDITMEENVKTLKQIVISGSKKQGERRSTEDGWRMT